MARMAVVSAAPSLFDPKRPVYSIEMDFDTFAAIERCPKQRDETKRVNKPHLRKYSPSMQCVAVAVLPTGKTYKVDGHTRVELVMNGKLPELTKSPMIVSVYSVRGMAEIRALYDTFDSTGASKNAAETIQSALSDLGITMTTPLLADGRFGSALSIAVKTYAQFDPTAFTERKPSRTEQIEFFRSALEMIDRLDIAKSRFNQGVLAAAILAYKKHGAAANDFFAAYNATNGLESGSARNAVRMLHEIRNRMKQDGRVAGGSVNDDQMANTLACFNRHLGNPSGFNERLPSPVRPIDFLRA